MGILYAAPMEILDQAATVIHQRNEEYGSPRQRFTTIAQLWSIYMETEITPQDAVIMMILLKCAREGNDPKLDNRVDIIGYVNALNEIVEGDDEDFDEEELDD